MSLHPDLSDQSLYAPFDEIKDCKTDTTWVLYGYVPRTDKIKVECTGTGNLADMMENMSEGKVHYGFIRYNLNGSFKFAYIAWCGEGVQGLRKGSFTTHAVDMSKFLDGYHVQINARKEEDLDEASLLSRFKTAAASHGRRNLKAREQGSSGSDAPAPLPTPPGKDFTSGGFQGNLRSQSDSFWSEQRANEQQAKPAAPAPRQAPVSSGGGSIGKKWEQQQTVTEQPASRAAPPPARVNTAAFSAPPAAAPARTAPAPKVAAPPPKVAAPPPKVEAPAPVPAPTFEPPAAPEESWDSEPVQDSYSEPAQDNYSEPAQDEWGGQQDSGSYQEEPAYDQQDSGSYQEPAYDDQQQGSYDDSQQGGYDDAQQGSWGEETSYDASADQSYSGDAADTSIKCKALYTYEGENEGDLAFNEGDIITVLDQSDPAGWWEGQLGSTTGFFPSNFVQQL